MGRGAIRRPGVRYTELLIGVSVWSVCQQHRWLCGLVPSLHIYWVPVFSEAIPIFGEARRNYL